MEQRNCNTQSYIEHNSTAAQWRNADPYLNNIKSADNSSYMPQNRGHVRHQHSSSPPDNSNVKSVYSSPPHINHSNMDPSGRYTDEVVEEGAYVQSPIKRRIVKSTSPMYEQTVDVHNSLKPQPRTGCNPRSSVRYGPEELESSLAASPYLQEYNKCRQPQKPEPVEDYYYDPDGMTAAQSRLCGYSITGPSRETEAVTPNTMMADSLENASWVEDGGCPSNESLHNSRPAGYIWCKPPTCATRIGTPLATSTPTAARQ